jgi:hypothetical protein
VRAGGLHGLRPRVRAGRLGVRAADRRRPDGPRRHERLQLPRGHARPERGDRDRGRSRARHGVLQLHADRTRAASPATGYDPAEHAYHICPRASCSRRESDVRLSIDRAGVDVPVQARPACVAALHFTDDVQTPRARAPYVPRQCARCCRKRGSHPGDSTVADRETAAVAPARRVSRGYSPCPPIVGNLDCDDVHLIGVARVRFTGSGPLRTRQAGGSDVDRG